MVLRRIARALRLGPAYVWLRNGPYAGRLRSQHVYRRLHALALSGRGYGASDVHTSGESALLARLSRERPDIRVVFDVGANKGDWSQLVSRLWPEAVIHAFEPATATFLQLEEATSGLNVRPVNAALSSASGEATLHEVEGQSGLTSLHDRDLKEHGMRMTPTETVRLIRLDDYAADHGIDHVDLLKIDAEGHDLAVLQGATGSIDRGAIDLIQFEFGGANLDSRTFLRDFVRLLEPHYRIQRLMRDGVEPLVYGEHEEVFVTSNFLAERRL